MKKLLKRLLIAAAVLLVVFVGGLSAFVHWYTAQVEGSYFDSDGVRIHYTDEGSGPPVLLLHAYNQNSSINWRRFGIVEEVVKSRRVICMDLRGHGLSQKLYRPEQYGAALADDAARLLDHLGISKARVAGFSLGGLVALKLAERHPERVERLVLCASGTFHIEPRKPPAAAHLSSRGQRFLYWLTDIDYRCMQACWLGYHGLSSDHARLAKYDGPVNVLMGDQDTMVTSLDEMRQAFGHIDIKMYAGWHHATVMLCREFRKDLCEILMAP